MQLSKNSLEILKNFSTINSNLVVKTGSKLETISPSKDIFATFETSEKFDKQVSIFNLNEFLGVVSAFETPELDLDDKFMTIKQNKQKVKYVYADEALLITPPEKGIKFPIVDVSFTLSDSILSKLQKMASILAAEDFAVIGDGETIALKVFDKKNPTANTFDLDTEVPTGDTFQINFKIEKLKLFPGTYTVDISNKKISRFTYDGDLKLSYLIAVEADSVFAD